jgi:hypothetical protein
VRDNVKAEGPEDYLRKPITVPFLDYVLNVEPLQSVSFVSDLRLFGGFLRVLRFPSPIKLTNAI